MQTTETWPGVRTLDRGKQKNLKTRDQELYSAKQESSYVKKRKLEGRRGPKTDLYAGRKLFDFSKGVKESERKNGLQIRQWELKEGDLLTRYSITPREKASSL